MKKISVGFSKALKPTLIGNIIQKVMKTKYSHTYIHLFNSNQIFEAEFVGVRLMGYDRWLKKSKVVEEVTIEMSDDRYSELLMFIAANKGKSYSTMQLFRILLRKLGLDVTRQNGDESYICSELVARALAPELGLDTDNLDYITPRQIYEMVKKLADNFRAGTES